MNDFVRRVRRVDAALVLLLFVGASLGSYVYWKRTYAPLQPFYYQHYFEPAVFIGCNRGFVVSRPQVPEMVPFLWNKTDRFSCDAIPANAPLGTDDMFQLGSWRYLMLTVGYTWRIFGVRWSALGPLFGVAFGTSIAVLYGIFRLGMGPLLSTVGTLLLCFSEYHLAYYSILRDYLKAPFTLALFFLLGLIVARRLSSRALAAAGAAYGAVAGIGYGFRPDLVADLPPFFLVLGAFVAGGVTANLRAKSLAALACVAAFLVTAWPVISTQQVSRAGCQWHVVALGFARQFDDPLGVEPAPYEVAREYLDEWMYTTTTSYASRVHPGIGHIEFCEPEYGRATGQFVGDIVEHFPADIVVRAYASVLRVVELPFTRRPGNDDPRPDKHLERYGIGLAAVTMAVIVAAAADLRIGVFLLCFLLYFGGLPGTQFDPRHFFHLEFIPWWSIGFVIASAAGRRETRRSWRRAAIVLTACVIALALLLAGARAYQQHAARAMIGAYVAADRDPIARDPDHAGAYGPIRVTPHTDPETADFISLDVDRSRCGDHATATFDYEPTRRAYSRAFEIGHRADASGLSQVFMPIYDGFTKLTLADAPDGCVVGVYRVREARRFGLLLETMLAPGWKHEPLYQRLARVF